MKSWHYIVIFVAVVAVVGGLIWYNASTIDDIDSEVVTVKKTSVTKQGDHVVVEKEINVLTDADIEMDGNWAISTLGLQLLLHKNEDHKFQRGFWRQSGVYEPSLLNRSEHYSSPPEYNTDITDMPLPKTVIQDPAGEISYPKEPICLPDQNSPKLAWRFKAKLGSLGSNGTDFDGYNTPELAEKRLKELRPMTNALMVNGLLSRHTFPNHLARVKKMLTMLIAEGHKQGFKMIDHQDLTLLWNKGAGFRVLTEHTP